MNDDRRFGQPARTLRIMKRTLQRRRRHVPGIRLRIDEDRLGATVTDWIRARNEGEAGAEYKVAAPYAKQLQR
ncbi:hypothetical protein D3C78_1405940 [compost metagenome]